MPGKAPGRHHRDAVSLIDLFERFPDEDSARLWFEGVLWPSGERHCPRCGSCRTAEASHRHMPYRCSDCRSYFGAKTGTAMEQSKVPLRKWAIAIYLELTSLKGVSSMKLHRDLGVTQKTAWFMLHRIREGLLEGDDDPFTGAVEADETFVGGYRRGGQGGRGKAVVAAARSAGRGGFARGSSPTGRRGRCATSFGRTSVPTRRSTPTSSSPTAALSRVTRRSTTARAST